MGFIFSIIKKYINLQNNIGIDFIKAFKKAEVDKEGLLNSEGV